MRGWWLALGVGACIGDPTATDGLPPTGDTGAGTEDATSATASTADTAGTTTSGTCVDTTSFTWSAPEPIHPATFLDPDSGAIALDDRGEAWFLAEEGFGSSITMSLTHLGGDGAWSLPEIVRSSTQARPSWQPRVVVNGSGDGAATLLHDDLTGGSQHAVPLFADGTSTTLLTLAPDEAASSIVPAVDGSGTVVVVYSALHDGTRQVFASDGVSAGSPVFIHPDGASVIDWSLDPSGHGMLFAVIEDADYSVVALPYDAKTGFGEPEPVVAGGINGWGGAWLGDGRAVFVHGWRPDDTSRIQIHVTERLPDGTWTAGARIDTGDGSSHATAFDPVVAGAPGEAFVKWTQPSGEVVARFVAGLGPTDVLELPAGSVYDLAADPCGNAIVVKRVSGDNRLVGRYHRSGEGWLEPVALEGGAQASAAQWAQVAFSSSGEAIAVMAIGDDYQVSRFR